MKVAASWPLVLTGCLAPAAFPIPDLKDSENAQLLWVEAGPLLYAADRDHPLRLPRLAAGTEGHRIALAFFEAPLSELRVEPGEVSLFDPRPEDGSIFRAPSPSRRLEGELRSSGVDWAPVDNFGDLEMLQVHREIRPVCVDKVVMPLGIPRGLPDVPGVHSSRIAALLPFDDDQLLAATASGALYLASPGRNVFTDAPLVSGYEGGATDQRGRAWLVTEGLGVRRVTPPDTEPEVILPASVTGPRLFTSVSGGNVGAEIELVAFVPAQQRVYFFDETSMAWKAIDVAIPVNGDACGNACHGWRVSWLGHEDVVLVGRGVPLIHLRQGIARAIPISGCEAYTAFAKLSDDELAIGCQNNGIDLLVRTDRNFNRLSQSIGLRNYPSYTLLGLDGGVVMSGGDAWTAFVPREMACEPKRASASDVARIVPLGDRFATVGFDFDDTTHSFDRGAHDIGWFELGTGEAR